ncbi:chemotaxis protein CheW [Methylomonas methanica]|uniref:CheW domain protein n=1 Tax=Methylomonas methanica (strain DSM 25384 / MC09) TaxID=857087 RepID=G0A0A3_METMM|nr:chemotaxis protein CheW [Methylomonas methanica]AEG02409.1 CheW domain protein [Methylomonas methanica MC09]
MKQTKPPQQVVQQKLALDAYLSTLLDEVPEAVPSCEPPQIIAKPQEKAIEPVVTQRIAVPRPILQPLKNELVALEKPAKLHPLSVMPDWAQHEFQALFFKVDHLILATPLVDLSRTIKIDRKPGKIPGQPSWFMGLLDENDSRIGVLDTGQLIFGKLRGSQRDLEAKPFKCILITQDKRWGLACDEILSIGKLKPDKVRWRTSRQKKPWLIGTVIEELTAIIDLQELVPHRKRPT